MMQVPPLSKFYEAVEAGRIMMDTDPTDRLVCFRYTEETAAHADWDEVTLHARGIVFERATGEIIAKPFYKFFNYHELFSDTELAKKCRLALEKAGLPTQAAGKMEYTFEKIDGSLGIAYYYDGEWYVNTPGNFTSPQAQFATQWLRKHIAAAKKKFKRDMILDPEYTHLFEITWSKDLHPIKYDRDELVLLALINKHTGKEMFARGLMCELAFDLLGSRTPEYFKFETLGEIADTCKELPSNKEGFVVTWENGFKLKMKGDAYLKLLAFYENCTEKMIWRSYDPNLDIFHAHMDAEHGYRFLDNEPLVVPEELFDIRNKLELYRVTFAEKLDGIISTGDFIKICYKEQRDRIAYITEHFDKAHQAALIAYVSPNMRMDYVKTVVNKCLMKPKPNTADGFNAYFGYKE